VNRVKAASATDTNADEWLVPKCCGRTSRAISTAGFNS